ncbi:MAG: GldG family protein [Clostridiales bacterium]|jgi:ABC-2 type transport system permease protein|nr:GldG family protein [Clostridiales bacterium]
MNKDNYRDNPEQPATQENGNSQPAGGAEIETAAVSDAEFEAQIDALTESGDGEAPAPAAGGPPPRKKGMSRKFRYGSTSTIVTVVVIVAVFLLNIVAGILNDRYPLSLDLTKEKLFSMSDESAKVAANVKEDVEVLVFYPEEYFASSTTDTAASSILRQFYELMPQVEAKSGGHVKTTYIDLTANPTLATKYSKYDVATQDILFLAASGKYQKANLNDLAQTSSSSYSYSQTITGSNVEKTVASKLNIISSEYTPVVTILTGHEEASAVVSGVQSLLGSNNYEVRELDITGSEDIGDDVNTLVIAGPTKDFTSDEIKRIREWLNNDGKMGRNLMVFVNYTGECPNLYDFLNVEYGIEVTDNVVMESDPSRQYSYNSFYTYADVADSDYTIEISGSKKVLTMVTRQLLTHKDSSTSNTLFNTDLITFSDKARLMKMQDATGKSDESQAAGDNLSSLAFDPEETPVIGAAMATKWDTGENNEELSTRVFVSGSADLVNSSIISQMRTVYNGDMVLGVMNGVTGNEDSVNISTLSLERETLEIDGKLALWLGFGVFTIGLPVITLVICLIVFLRRRHL